MSIKIRNRVRRRKMFAVLLGTIGILMVQCVDKEKINNNDATNAKSTLQRWLVIAAHPDDEAKASPLVLTERKAGDDLIVLMMRLTGESGLPGRKNVTQEEAIKHRTGELEKAVAHLGGDIRWWRPPHPENENIAKTPETVAKMAELLNEIKPTRIITHWREDTHPDHFGTAEIVNEALKKLDYDGLTAYYFGQPGREETQPNFIPNHYVDISDPSGLSYVLWSRCVHSSQMSFDTMSSYIKYYKEHGKKVGSEYAAGYVMQNL